MTSKKLTTSMLQRPDFFNEFLTQDTSRLCGSSCGTAYALGLLNNVGALGLMTVFPDEYPQMLTVSSDFGFDQLETERLLFEIDHCAAGAYLAQRWGFPNELVAAMATHHDEPEADNFNSSNLIKLSWRLSDLLGYAASSPDKVWSYEALLGLLPTLTSSWLGESSEAAHAELTARLDAAQV